MSQIARLLFRNKTWNVGSFANLKYLSIGFCVAKLFSFTTTSNELTQHCDISRIYLLHLDLSKIPGLTGVCESTSNELVEYQYSRVEMNFKVGKFFDDFIKLGLSHTDSMVNLGITS